MTREKKSALTAVIENYNPFEQNMLTKKIFLKALWHSIFGVNKFSDLQYYCSFIGHPRSGHTAVGSILDAHPNMTISHELNALNLVRLGVPRRFLFELLIEKSRDFTNTGRTWSGYSYLIEDAWQGKFEKLKIIGDKKGDRTGILLSHDKGLIEKLRKTVRLPLKFIHVIRNPYDNIARHALRNGLTLEQGIEEYFAVSDCVERVRVSLTSEEWLAVYHESLIETPREQIKELCRFLSQECSDDYLNLASKMVLAEPNLSRKNVNWTNKQIMEVKERSSKYSYLTHYCIDE